jgi:Cu(I)/Ag(I) efflux system membrane protein CusA/SilA
MDEYTSSGSAFSRFLKVWIARKPLMALVLAGTLIGGVICAPFDWDIHGIPRRPVPTDAIPDIGENQQIVFTVWEGRSPKDVENQITYPLTVALLGLSGVKAVRSNSFFGFSTIYVIFHDDVEFYWSRSRILEKLNSLPRDTLPGGVQPSLGPDATALGQVFWYTVEGEGFSLQELRTIQDYYVRYALQSAGGVSEVASVGGYVKEYQVDVDPNAMRAHRVTLTEVVDAVRMANLDVGAGTIEVNRVEHTVRGLGFIRSVEDIEDALVKVNQNVPLYVKDVARVVLGPETRRGALDKEGAEVVGGVVVVRFGENPLAVIKNVKAKMREIAPGLPTKELPDGRISKVQLIPFYDRTGLIHETLATLYKALSEEILVTVIVVIVMVNHLMSSALISAVVPLAVLLTFVGMKAFGVDANIMALSGIAIAIGVMVDMGIILCENILRRLEEAPPEADLLMLIRDAVIEVGGAVITSTLTTIISFLPVFTLTGPEGKLFGPVAYTKTLAVGASLILALTLIPPLAHIFFRKRVLGPFTSGVLRVAPLVLGLIAGYRYSWWIGAPLVVTGIVRSAAPFLPTGLSRKVPTLFNGLALILVVLLLTKHWMPLGLGPGFVKNAVFCAGLIFGLLGFRRLLTVHYERILRWALRRKAAFLTIPVGLVLFGAVIWLGVDRVFLPIRLVIDEVAAKVSGESGQSSRGLLGSSGFRSALSHAFPGLGKEFMPSLDEGSFLFMPTTMPHASIGEALDVVSRQDTAIRAIPEVDSVVGKIGRVESALDPAPLSMIETVISYLPEFKTDPATGEPVVDPKTGGPVRNWRPHIRSSDDIWREIVEAAKLPGVTSAPKLQPIAARVVMLQSGMRAAMGVKVKANSLEEVERVGLEIEGLLRQVPVIEADSVIADRVTANPYVEIEVDRKAAARYGIKVQDVQDVLETAVGGRRITVSVEGRERYPVRIRWQRELRDSLEELGKTLVAGEDGVQIPLSLVARIRHTNGPMTIKSEDASLVGYVLFDGRAGAAEVDVVESARSFIESKIASGAFRLPPGASYAFAGSYENQVRSEKQLALVIPSALFLIFVILYVQFKSVAVSLNVFSGIFVAWSGGFLMLWLYAQPWFLDFNVFGVSMREVFQVKPYNLSVAVWVGFLALFGIAVNDGVIFSTYLDQVCKKRRFSSVQELREAVVRAGMKRVRPALMTTATTILALIPVLTSRGRGADVAAPMALPTFGGMMVDLITIFVVPTIYCLLREMRKPAPETALSPSKE